MSDLSTFDDSINDPDYGNPDSLFKVSDFENMSEYEQLLLQNKESNNTSDVADNDEVQCSIENTDENNFSKGKIKR